MLDFVTGNRIDLLVLGALRGSAVDSLLLGSLTERLTRAAPCDVHLVK